MENEMVSNARRANRKQSPFLLLCVQLLLSMNEMLIGVRVAHRLFETLPQYDSSSYDVTKWRRFRRSRFSLFDDRRCKELALFRSRLR